MTDERECVPRDDAARRATTGLEAYRELERRIRTTDADAMRARWESGRLMLAERQANGGRLPDRRLADLANALAISGAEIKNRVQFAEEYATEEDVANALARLGSWHEIVRRGLGDRGSAPTSVESAPAGADRDQDDDDEDRYDAYRIPLGLRPWFDTKAQQAYRAGMVFGDNYPGEHAVKALHDFFEENPDVRRMWEEWLERRRTGLRAAA